MCKSYRVCLWVSVIVLWTLRGLAGDTLYSVVPIWPPAFEGGADSSGRALNDAGQVLGSRRVYYPDGTQGGRAFLYTDGAGSVELPEPTSWAFLSYADLNNGGQMAVYGRPSGSDQVEPYRYSQATGFQPLGTFGGSRTETSAINNSGQVTGFSEGTDGHSYAYRYTDGVGLENLGMAFNNSRGYAINDRGWVAGYADGNAVIFRDEGNTVLLPGVARGINEAGNVVGTTTIVPGHPTAFVLLNGEMLILGDDVFGQPILYDINNQNVAVGSTGGGTALIWSYSETSSGLVDLNTLIPEDSGWTLIGATAINDAGQITGGGIYNGEFLGFRLDPIPEPSTWLLFGLGSLALWGWQRGKPREGAAEHPVP